MLAGRKPAQPLALRGDIGDCIAVTLTNEQRDTLESPFTKVNMHIHHVQFDTQASDGVITGLSYEQSIRPHTIEDPVLTADVPAGARVLPLSSTAKFQDGEFIAVGQGTEDIEIRQIVAHDATTVTLDRDLDKAHPNGQGAGVEFTQYRWYPDVQLDNIFWHDHVDGIHAWGHGLVGQLIVEPPGSTFHDPKTGERGRFGHDRRHPHAEPRLAVLRSPVGPAEPVRARPRAGVRLVPRDGAVDAGREPHHRLDAQPAVHAVGRAPRRRRGDSGRPVAPVLLLHERRSEHAVAEGLLGRPVRRPHDQRRPERRHASCRRAPVPAREPLPRRRRQAEGDADRRPQLRHLRALHGDPRQRQGRRRQARRLPVHERPRSPLPPGRVGHPAGAPGTRGRPPAAAGPAGAGRRTSAADADRRPPARSRRAGRPLPAGRAEPLVRDQRARPARRHLGRGPQGGLRAHRRRRRPSTTSRRTPSRS